MWEFIVFIRDRIVDFGVLLDRYSFDIMGMNVSIFEMFIGFLTMAIIISVFWKGARAG